MGSKKRKKSLKKKKKKSLVRPLGLNVKPLILLLTKLPNYKIFTIHDEIFWCNQGQSGQTDSEVPVGEESDDIEFDGKKIDSFWIINSRSKRANFAYVLLD